MGFDTKIWIEPSSCDRDASAFGDPKGGEIAGMDRSGGHVLWSLQGWPEAAALCEELRVERSAPLTQVASLAELLGVLERQDVDVCVWRWNGTDEERQAVASLSDKGPIPILAIDFKASVGTLLDVLGSGRIPCVSTEVGAREWVDAIEAAIERRSGERRAGREESRSCREGSLDGLIGRGAWRRRLSAQFDSLDSVEPCSVVVQGELGTGRHRVARAFHIARCQGRKFFESLYASELRDITAERLLGSASTPGLLESTEAGTVFLAEPEQLSQVASQRLEHYLTTGVVLSVDGQREAQGRASVVFAAVPTSELSAPPFRRARAVLSLPRLAERIEDLPDLVEFFGGRAAQGSGYRGISEAALGALAQAPWPGNLAELKAVLERAILQADGVVELAHLPLELRCPGREYNGDASGARYVLPPEGIDIDLVVGDFLDQALHLSSGNKSRAAKLLGIHRDQVRYWVKKYGLTQWVRTSGTKKPKKEGPEETGAPDAEESGGP